MVIGAKPMMTEETETLQLLLISQKRRVKRIYYNEAFLIAAPDTRILFSIAVRSVMFFSMIAPWIMHGSFQDRLKGLVCLARDDNGRHNSVSGHRLAWPEVASSQAPTQRQVESAGPLLNLSPFILSFAFRYPDTKPPIHSLKHRSSTPKHHARHQHSIINVHSKPVLLQQTPREPVPARSGQWSRTMLKQLEDTRVWMSSTTNLLWTTLMG